MKHYVQNSQKDLVNSKCQCKTRQSFQDQLKWNLNCWPWKLWNPPCWNGLKPCPCCDSGSRGSSPLSYFCLFSEIWLKKWISFAKNYGWWYITRVGQNFLRGSNVDEFLLSNFLFVSLEVIWMPLLSSFPIKIESIGDKCIKEIINDTVDYDQYSDQNSYWISNIKIDNYWW